MNETIQLLDNGYVKLVESWGSDERIIEAARMSTDKGFIGWEDIQHSGVCSRVGLKPDPCSVCGARRGDKHLLRFLWEHKHYTPFEMAGMTIEVQAPIFVFREWHRHRTQSYNELSARYTELPNLFYLPTEERIKAGKQSQKNKQGSEEGLNAWEADEVYMQMETCYEYCRDVYEELLKRGVARELARIVIPVGQYSRMRASANLRNWLAFLTLRMDEAAQYEIRQYANAVASVIEQLFPRTYGLFSEG